MRILARDDIHSYMADPGFQSPWEKECINMLTFFLSLQNDVWHKLKRDSLFHHIVFVGNSFIWMSLNPKLP